MKASRASMATTDMAREAYGRARAGRPRLLRRLRRAARCEGARRPDPAPDDGSGLDLGARRAVRARRAVGLPARVRAGRDRRGRAPAEPLVPATRDRRDAPRL